MTEIEHLLICLSEECAEIQKAISKALRFGLDDGYPGGATTNFQDITKELNDLEGVLQLLSEYLPSLSYIKNQEEINKKKARVLEFMEYARKQGNL